MAEANGDVLYASGTEYVSHHLGFLTYGKLDGHWGFAHTPEEAAQMGFWAINVDTMLISMILGVLFMGFLLFRLSQGYFRRPWRRAKLRRDDYRIRYRKR